MSKHKLIRAIMDNQFLRFSSEGIVLASGLVSPMYVDLRPMRQHDDLMDLLGDLFVDNLMREYVGKDVTICGVPNGATKLASVLHTKTNLPLRVEQKYCDSNSTLDDLTGKSTILIEDVLTSGSSACKLAHRLESQGAKIEAILAVVDRQQNGVNLLEKEGYQVKTLFKIREIFDLLVNDGCLGTKLRDECEKWIDNNQFSHIQT